MSTNVNMPDMKAMIDALKRDVMLSINCHALGTVQSFDSSLQTAKISINYKRMVNGVATDYPVLVDCPIVSLFGGLGGLTFPISKGDTCLVIFNDRDIDNWFFSGQIQPPRTQRLHSFSDALAIVGVRSKLNKKTDYNSTDTVLYYDDTKITLSDKVKIENAVTTLLTVLNGLIDVVKGISGTVAAAPGPVTFSSAWVAQLESYKSTIGGLLE